MKRFRLTLAILVALGAVQAQGASADPTPLYWGAVMSGEVYGQGDSAPKNMAAWDLFEEHAGKEVTLVHQSQPWGVFDSSALDATLSRGAIPIVTMGLSGGTTLADVVAGNQDALIRAWAKKAKAWGYPFLLVPWWEMNGFWYVWGRDSNFVAAWRHFHDLVVSEGATNVTWAWVPNEIWSDPESDPAPYYPGDAYVDWVGLDSYNFGTNPLQPNFWETPDEVVTPTLDVLEEIAPGKPVCICETASTEVGGDKAAWIADMFDNYLPNHPQVKAFVWFNWNAPQFNGPHEGERWDWPIESSSAAQTAFRDSIAADIYLSSLPPLTRLAKVPMPEFPPPPQTPGPQTPGSEQGTCPGGRVVPNLTVGTAGADVLIGTGRDDQIKAGRGNDRIDSLAGADCISGDRGNDKIESGGGRDSIFGGRGNDLIRAASGGRDLVDCGRGRDRAVVGRSDRVRHCEMVRTV
jgi:hypothetical protein